MREMKIACKILCLVLTCLMCIGETTKDCEVSASDVGRVLPKMGDSGTTPKLYKAGDYVIIHDSEIPLTASPILLPVASGSKTVSCDRAIIDYSNTSNGYIMMLYRAYGKKVKAQVTCPNGLIYIYDVHSNVWESFPLSEGNGKYTCTLLENVGSDRYSQLLSTSFDVTIEDEFAPFIRPNQYVNYVSADTAIATAKTLVSGKRTDIEKVVAVYDWVVSNLTYDTALASNVKLGYLPVLDSVIQRKKGICFDYAALMTGMLRSQFIPCKLVVGYAGTSYHAWISVYTKETGWVDNVLYFDGKSWHRMDPTFASTAGKSSEVMRFIGDGRNYKAKYVY